MRLESLVVAGEGSLREFKEQLPPAGEGARKVMKTVAAFANGQGGTVLFGVTNDGEVVGVEADRQRTSPVDRLTNLIRNWVQPLPPFEVELLPVPDHEDRVVVVVVVEPGTTPPYGAGTTAERLVYYIRRGATSFAATPDEVRRLARDVDGQLR
jgi:predicted HTH transcriptional regulator